MGEWLIPPVCKTGAERLRRFESCPRHQKANMAAAALRVSAVVLALDRARARERSIARIAQSVERVLGKNEVSSSSLDAGSIRRSDPRPSERLPTVKVGQWKVNDDGARGV